MNPRQSGSNLRVTDPCPRGHIVIAHSAIDGCVYCDCAERYLLAEPPLEPDREENTDEV